MGKRTRHSMATSLTAISCNCGKMRGAVGLSLAGKSLRNTIEWVCSYCLKPTEGWLNITISRCENCLDEFSAPWEEICSKCFNIEHSDIELVEGRVVRTPHREAPTYKGWAWAREEHVTRERERRERQIREHGSVGETKTQDEVISA